jgi:glycosyltransferase involved in cell wall biosynthesis
MDLIFITDARYVKTPDGNVFSLESSFAYPLYERYLNYFDNIYIFARLNNVNDSDVIKENLVSAKCIKVIALPYYVGFNGFIRQCLKIKFAVQNALLKYVNKNTAIICRVPGRMGAIAIYYLKQRHIPYGIEIVGDPFDVLAKGAIRHPLRPLIKVLSFYSLKKIAYNAPAALYVTRQRLQTRYPCSNFSVGASDVVLQQDGFIKQNRLLFQGEYIRIIGVGTLEQLYKAPDIALLAMKILKTSGVKCNLTWAGEGIYRKEMEKLAENYNLKTDITFLGKLSSITQVRSELDKSDIFIMPSRMEGLPRAMVEAMARALPCIGTNVGGIPELLDPNMIIPINDANALAEKIKYLIDNPDIANRQAVRNLSESKNYSEEVLGNERKRFYGYLKNLYTN